MLTSWMLEVYGTMGNCELWYKLPLLFEGAYLESFAEIKSSFTVDNSLRAQSLLCIRGVASYFF